MRSKSTDISLLSTRKNLMKKSFILALACLSLFLSNPAAATTPATNSSPLLQSCLSGSKPNDCYLYLKSPNAPNDINGVRQAVKMANNNCFALEKLECWKSLKKPPLCVALKEACDIKNKLTGIKNKTIFDEALIGYRARINMQSCEDELERDIPRFIKNETKCALKSFHRSFRNTGIRFESVLATKPECKQNMYRGVPEMCDNGERMMQCAVEYKCQRKVFK